MEYIKMFNKRFLNIIVLVCVILNITCSSIIIINPSDNIQDVNSSNIIFNSEENNHRIISSSNEKENTNEFPKAEKYFPFGTNILYETIDDLANRQGLSKYEWIEVALDDMQAHHINTIHFNNLFYDDPKGNGLHLFVTLAEERGIRLYPQAVLGGYPLTPYYFPIWLGTKAERDNYFETRSKPAYATLINKYKDSETILVWGVIEEPNINNIPTIIPELKVWTDYIDGLDPNHPAVVLYGKIEAIQEAKNLNLSRIIPAEVYPFFNNSNRGPVTHSGQLNLYDSRSYARYVEARECGSPFWVMPQGFKLYEGSSGFWRWRYPTPNEMYWEAWLAIVNGAKGIIYWTYTSSPYDGFTKGNTIYGLVDRDGNPTEQWDTIDDIWFNIEPFTKIIVDIDESNTSIISNLGEEIRARTFQRSIGNERYIIVVNTDVVNSKTTNLELTSSENIYDLRTLEQVTSDQLYNHVLLPGRGNIYLVGTEEDFNRYLQYYVIDNINRNDNDTDTTRSAYPFNIYFLLLIVSGIISLVLIFIKRRLSPKRHKHKSYSYKY